MYPGGNILLSFFTIDSLNNLCPNVYLKESPLSRLPDRRTAIHIPQDMKLHRIELPSFQFCYSFSKKSPNITFFSVFVIRSGRRHIEVAACTDYSDMTGLSRAEKTWSLLPFRACDWEHLVNRNEMCAKGRRWEVAVVVIRFAIKLSKTCQFLGARCWCYS